MTNANQFNTYQPSTYANTSFITVKTRPALPISVAEGEWDEAFTVQMKTSMFECLYSVHKRTSYIQQQQTPSYVLEYSIFVQNCSICYTLSMLKLMILCFNQCTASYPVRIRRYTQGYSLFFKIYVTNSIYYYNQPQCSSTMKQQSETQLL